MGTKHFLERRGFAVVVVFASCLIAVSARGAPELQVDSLVEAAALVDLQPEVEDNGAQVVADQPAEELVIPDFPEADDVSNPDFTEADGVIAEDAELEGDVAFAEDSGNVGETAPAVERATGFGALVSNWLSGWKNGGGEVEPPEDPDMPRPDRPHPPGPHPHPPHPHPPPHGPPPTKRQEHAKLIVGKALEEYYPSKVTIGENITGTECVAHETSYLVGNVTAQIEKDCKEETTCKAKEHFCEFAKEKPFLAALATLSAAEVDPIGVAYMRCQVAGPCSPDTDHVLGNLTNVRMTTDLLLFPAVLRSLRPRPPGPPHRPPHHPPPRRHHHHHGKAGPWDGGLREAVLLVDRDVPGLEPEVKSEKFCKSCMERKMELSKAVVKNALFRLCHSPHTPPPALDFCTFAAENKRLTKTAVLLRLQPWRLAHFSCTAEGFCRGPPLPTPPFGPHPHPHPHPGPDPFGPHPGPDPFGPHPHPGPGPFGPHPGPGPFGPHPGPGPFGPHPGPGPFGPHPGPDPFGPHRWPKPHHGRHPFGPHPRPGGRRFGPHMGPENWNVINFNVVKPAGPSPRFPRPWGPGRPHFRPDMGPIDGAESVASGDRARPAVAVDEAGLEGETGVDTGEYLALDAI